MHLFAGVCLVIAATQPAPKAITLEQAYDTVLASDQTIQIAFLEIRKASLLPWSALTPLGPQVTGNASYQGAEQRQSSGGVTSRLTSDTREAGISLQQPLLDFTVPPAYRFGKLSSRAARLQYRFTVRETLFGVAQAYYTVLKQQQIVAVNQQTLDLAAMQLDLAQKQYNVGVVARTDVLRAKATIEGARSTLIQAQGTLDINRDTLSNILNLGGKTDFRVVEPPDAIPGHELFESILTSAYERREDFQVSKIAVEQEIAKRNTIVGEYGPRVVAQAGTVWSETHSNTGGSSVPYSVDGLVSVQIPFLTGGQREIDLRTAGHQVDETRLNLEQKSKSIEAEVKTAWVLVESLRESLKALRAAVEAATQNYKDVDNQYRAGTATSLDVQSALRDLNNSRTTLTSQTYDYQVALRNLQRVKAAFEQSRIDNLKME